jgi:hypothetical protein
MPVLETIDNITPRSAVRHRPIADDAARSRKRPTPIAASPITPVAQRTHCSQPALAPIQADTDIEVAEWQRTEDVEEESLVPARRRTGTNPKPLPKMPRPQAAPRMRNPLQHVHPLLYLGVGMLLMLTLWVAIIGISNWVTTTMDNIRYGYPRTYQTDAFVGHNETAGTPSHFIAINLHGHIEVIELPGGDAGHARIYIGPQLFGSGSDLVPVTLSFIDVNGDHKPDMIINLQGSQIVYINAQGGFRPLLPSERPQVEQFLQQHQH